MGYSTYWSDASLTIDPPLSPEEVDRARWLGREFYYNGLGYESNSMERKLETFQGYCDWRVSDDGSKITPEGERGDPVEWLWVVHREVLAPGGHQILGKLSWEGDDGALEDSGRVVCEGDRIRVFDFRYQVVEVERAQEVKVPDQARAKDYVGGKN